MRRLVLAGLFVGVLLGCGSSHADEPVLPASGVGVLATGCAASASAGSGVVVGAAGQVVTVAHTVAGATSVVVVDAAGVELAAQVVGFDPEADLAVLRVEGLVAPPLDLGAVQLGTAQLLTWSVDGGMLQRSVEVTQRLSITIDDIYGTTSTRRSGIELAGDIVVGDSGGAVVSGDGAVIGIVYARSQSRASTAFATGTVEVGRVLGAVGSASVDTGRCV